MNTNLTEIYKQSIDRELENIRFRSFLKTRDSKKIDKIVHDLNDEISKAIDCTLCGNCCKKLSPKIEQKDIRRLSMAIMISGKKLEENYLQFEDDEYYFKTIPCAFLSENKCSVYETRPLDCKSYPHLHKTDFNFRLWSILNNYGICPIVYNVVEQLKNATNFRR